MIPRTRGALAAAALASVSAGVVVLTLAAAVSLEPVEGLSSTPAVRDSIAVRRPAAIPESRLLATVGRDPFHPERRRPDGRFPLDGRGGEQPMLPAPAVRTEPLRLMGTTLMAGGGGFALLARGERAPELVRVRQAFEGWKLEELERGRVVLRSSDSDSTLILEIERRSP